MAADGIAGCRRCSIRCVTNVQVLFGQRSGEVFGGRRRTTMSRSERGELSKMNQTSRDEHSTQIQQKVSQDSRWLKSETPTCGKIQ